MSMQPYPGLRPYEEDERRNFFGREADSKILIDQILANRLTLLFAATGVGKSSLLKASVIPRLKEPLGENLDVVYFNDWVVAPLPNLKSVTIDTLHEQGDLEKDVVEHDVLEAALPEFFEFCCLFTSQPFVIVLDQFEEFFRYRNNYPKEEFQAFVDQLTDVILNKAIPVVIVLSMREDYALELNAFKPKLPMILFENYYRLEKLTREAAKDAILIPAERVGFKYESVLFDMLLKDLLSRELDRSKGSMVAETIETVEPPYLQIICSQLWQRDQNDPQKTIRFSTYEKAGYAKGLLDTFIEKDVLSKFSFQEKQLSSKAFDHLVSRRGTKMPHTVEDLAQTIGEKPDDLQKVLEKLAKNRILRSQQRDDKVWYELYHDMFSHSIDDWNTVWKNRMRIRRSAIGIGLAALAGGAIFMGYDGFVNYTHTHLRMSLSDPYSMVELWQGEKGSLDIFHQQKFISQIDIPVKDREPDKRLPAWAVSENAALNAELIGALPLKDRVSAFSEDGQHKRALDIAEDSISDTEVSRSKDVIANVATIQMESASTLLWGKLAHVSRDSLREAIKGDFSPERAAYWLNDEKRVVEKLKSGNKQQTITLAEKFGGLVPGQEILAELIAQLKNDDSSVRSRVAQVLGQLGSEEALPELVAQLKDDDVNVRSSVAEALGQLGSEEALPALVAQMKDDDVNVRLSVTQALGRLGNEAALPALVAQLKDDQWEVRSSVMEALGQLGNEKALPALVAQLKDNDVNVRSSVAQTLGQLGSEEVLPVLVAQLKDDNSDMRSSVAEALGQLGSEKALSALVVQLKDDQWGVRSSVAKALGQLGSEEVLPVLVAQLKDDNAWVRSSVAEALGQLGSEKALPALVTQLKDNDVNVRSNVAQALLQLGSEEVLPVLVTQLKDNDVNVRSSVAQVLGQLGSEEALPALVAQLKDDDFSVRSSVAEALGQLGSEEALPVLVMQLKDDDVNVRSSVAEALGQLGSEKALPALVAQLKDDDVNVRSSVAEALGQLGSEKALPALVAQLKDDDVNVRSSVAEALGQLGSEKALPALVAQLKDDDVNVRSSVAEALGQLGNDEVLPVLVAQLKDDNAWGRLSVAKALGQLGSEEALPALVMQLNNDDSDVRSSVAEALGQLGSEEALSALMVHLKDDQWNIRSSVAEALGQLGNKEVLPALSNLFEQEKRSEIVKATAALGLLQLGDMQGYDNLLENINNALYSENYVGINGDYYENKVVMLQSAILTSVRGGQTAVESSYSSSSPQNVR